MARRKDARLMKGDIGADFLSLLSGDSLLAQPVPDTIARGSCSERIIVFNCSSFSLVWGLMDGGLSYVVENSEWLVLVPLWIKQLPSEPPPPFTFYNARNM